VDNCEPLATINCCCGRFSRVSLSQVFAMVAIWSMLFCDACGNLLPRINGPEGQMIPCDGCGSLTKGGKWPWYALQFSLLSSTDTASRVITSTSKPSAFPSVLRTKNSAVQVLNTDDLDTEARIEKSCPQCGREEMFYHTKQLRSADEGSTVFYRCECGYQCVHAPMSKVDLGICWLTCVGKTQTTNIPRIFLFTAL